MLKGFIYSEGGEALAQAAQWSCGCPIPGCIPGQVGWGPQQPDLVGGSPAHGRGVETRCFVVPSNLNHSMILLQPWLGAFQDDPLAWVVCGQLGDICDLQFTGNKKYHLQFYRNHSFFFFFFLLLLLLVLHKLLSMLPYRDLIALLCVGIPYFLNNELWSRIH